MKSWLAAVEGALAVDAEVSTGRAMSASACGRMSPSETGAEQSSTPPRVPAGRQAVGALVGVEAPF